MARPPRRLLPARAMLTAPQPEAVEAGTAILAAGGSAVDAVLACAFTQGVVDPLMCGVAGLGTMQVFDPASGRHVVIDGLSRCPAGAAPDIWASIFEGECADGYGYMVKGRFNEIGHQAVTTPGILRVFARAHAAFGRLPWADLFAPAIATAEAGWLIRPHVAGVFAMDETAYGRLPFAAKLGYSADGRALYLRADGTPKRLGELVRNPDLAASLRLLAAEGAECLYTGALGQRIVADMRVHGGLLDRDDLASFQPTEAPPLSITYRGHRIATPLPPAGGIMIAEMLRILERFDLAALGHNTPAYIRTVAEAMKYAKRDKDAHIGDPDFAPPPLDLLLADVYADACAARIRAGEKVCVRAGAGEGADTTTISAVDAEGMVVSVTHTLGLPSGVIPPGTGFMLNGAMNWFDPRPGRAGSIAPGKRRFSSLAPTIVFEGERPVMTLGAPGGAWIGVAITQVLLNVLDFGMGMQEAISAPRFSATTDAIDVSNRIPRATQKALEGMGYTVRRSGASYAFAGVHGITMWGGRLEGGADPQRDGYVGEVA